VYAPAYISPGFRLHSRFADVTARPADIALHEETVKVALSLSRCSVEFFKREAKRHRVPYQRMICALVDEYARRVAGSAARRPVTLNALVSKS
jgi:hypothetical protein